MKSKSGDEFFQSAKRRIAADRARKMSDDLAETEAEIAHLKEKVRCAMREIKRDIVDEPGPRPMEEPVMARSRMPELISDLLESGIDLRIIAEILGGGLPTEPRWRYCPYCGKKMDQKE